MPPDDPPPPPAVRCGNKACGYAFGTVGRTAGGQQVLRLHLGEPLDVVVRRDGIALVCPRCGEHKGWVGEGGRTRDTERMKHAMR